VTLNGETWLICRGRKFTDDVLFNDEMDRLVAMCGLPSRVVHGITSSADAMVPRWGERYGLEVIGQHYDWRESDESLGAIRNQSMLDLYKPHCVIAFPGGEGTADMVRLAKDRGARIEDKRHEHTEPPSIAVSTWLQDASKPIPVHNLTLADVRLTRRTDTHD
jgi:hypothetical protein